MTVTLSIARDYKNNIRDTTGPRRQAHKLVWNTATAVLNIWGNLHKCYFAPLRFAPDDATFALGAQKDILGIDSSTSLSNC